MIHQWKVGQLVVLGGKVTRVMSAVSYIRNQVAPRYLPDPPADMLGGMEG